MKISDDIKAEAARRFGLTNGQADEIADLLEACQ